MKEFIGDTMQEGLSQRYPADRGPEVQPELSREVQGPIVESTAPIQLDTQIYGFSIGELIAWLRTEAGSSSPEYFLCERAGNLNLQQVPEEYARLLLFFKEHKIERFLELGVGEGGSFLLNCLFMQSDLQIAEAVDDLSYAQPLERIKPKIAFLRQQIRAAIRFHHMSTTAFFASKASGTKYDCILIDADHSYKGVAQDFLNALLHIAPTGWLILHDIASNDACDVARLWQQIKTDDCIELVYSRTCGIGIMPASAVLGLGPLVDILASQWTQLLKRAVALQDSSSKMEEQIRQQAVALQDSSSKMEEQLRQKDQRLTELEHAILTREAELTDARQAAQALKTQLGELDAQLRFQAREKEEEQEKLTAELREKTSLLNRIYDSHGWKALLAYYRVRNKLLPEGTWRRNFSKRFLHLILTLGRGLPKQTQLIRAAAATPSAGEAECLGTVSQQEQVTPLSQNVASQDARSMSPEVATTGTIGNGANRQDYEILSQRITALRQSNLDRLSLKPPPMVSIKEDELSAHAESLIFQFVDQVKVSIVIPVFNNLKFTLECLTSVMKHSEGVDYEIVVVDDGSSDQTPEVLGRVANIVYIRNEKNLGFTHTCNRGAASARGEYVLFLNNDVQVTKNWLKPLVETFEDHNNVGAVGPKILYPDGRLQEAGALVNRDGTSRLIGLFDDPGLPRYNYTREVMYCSGASLLVDAKIFKEIGAFDIDLAPAYCEDWEISFRLRERGLRVMYNPKSVVIHHLSATSSNISEHYKMVHVLRNQQKLSKKLQHQIDRLCQIRLIALYLPQYHPIPENDRWWGKGFTEWTNVTKARPNFVGHYQPHLPTDLGFYDLRVASILDQQAELAKRYGIHGFCFFYYWFAGKRLLEAPIEEILRTNKPAIPFCIAWANENWTRKWDGLENEILVAQRHSDDDDRAVIRDMMRYLQHQYYIRINGKPLLIVYRANLFPDIKRTTQVWRDCCRRDGVGEIYLVMIEAFEHAMTFEHPSKYGFDASMEFPPHRMNAPINPPGQILNPNYVGVIHDYRQVVLKYLQIQVPGYTRFRSVMPSWDNTPRRQNDSVMFENASPGAYQAWLEAIIQFTHEQSFGDERIIFVNAWNEWGEGNHLEPDRKHGHGFLEATRNAQDVWLLRREIGQS